VIVPFPFGSQDTSGDKGSSSEGFQQVGNIYAKWAKHPAIVKLSRVVDLEKNCGYITMINTRGATSSYERLKSNIFTEDLKVSDPSHNSKKLGELTEETVKDNEVQEDSTSDDGYHLVVNPTPDQPKNGFKDETCAKLYQEELDNEFKITSDNSAEHPSREPQGYDPRRQKLESLRLDLKLTGAPGASTKELKSNVPNEEKVTEMHCFDDWTLLDCYFGIPLFDSGINQITCERMLRNELWKPSRYVLYLIILLLEN